MIIEYHRPDTKEKALDLLARKEPRTVVLGGGLHLNEIDDSPVSVVDLRELGLAGISLKGTSLHIGASVTLQSLLDQEGVPQALASAIRHQETYNRRQVATAAGAIVAGGGRSPVLCLLLALDAGITLLGKGAKQKMIQIGDFLPILEEELRGKMITEITIPAEIHGSYHYSARSPADLPIVAAAAARWPSGRTRVVLGGFGDQPKMVFDGPDSKGAQIAARDAYSEAGDQWASAEYRSETAAVLVGRCLNELSGKDQG